MQFQSISNSLLSGTSGLTQPQNSDWEDVVLLPQEAPKDNSVMSIQITEDSKKVLEEIRRTLESQTQTRATDKLFELASLNKGNVIDTKI